MQSLKKNWLVVSNMSWGIWLIFTQTLKSYKISLWWAILVQSIWGLGQKIKRSYLSCTGQWYKIWKTLTLWFQKWHEELGELLSLDYQKLWKLYIDVFFLSKAYTASARNFQRNYEPCHLWVLQSLNENCLVGWKMT